MPLTSDQIKELKDQLREQIASLPEDKRAQAEAQIESLSPQALETMLQQQQRRSPNSKSEKEDNKGVYRMIVDKEIPSKMIDENKNSIAVLEIKPISKGHTIIIPRKEVKNTKDLPKEALALAKKIASKLSNKLKAKSSEIQTEFKMGEIIVNVIPIYDKSLNINSPRLDVKEKELEELYQILRTIKRPKVIRIKKEKSSNSQLIKLPRRIA